MSNLFVKREVCPTCNGERSILCCSCSVEDECQVLVCPSCNGKGEKVTYNKPAIAIAGLAVVAIILGIFFCR